MAFGLCFVLCWTLWEPEETIMCHQAKIAMTAERVATMNEAGVDIALQSFDANAATMFKTAFHI